MPKCTEGMSERRVHLCVISLFFLSIRLTSDFRGDLACSQLLFACCGKQSVGVFTPDQVHTLNMIKHYQNRIVLFKMYIDVLTSSWLNKCMGFFPSRSHSPDILWTLYYYLAQMQHESIYFILFPQHK